MPVDKKILTQINKGELINLCSRLIQLKGENPPGDTTEIGGYIMDRLESKGLSVKKYEPKKNMINLVSSIGSGKPNLVLCGHLDVFPPGAKWRNDPFSGKVVNGRIFGRGAVDMKAGLSATMTAFEILAKCEDKLQGKLTLAFYSDEESMGFGGGQWMLNNVDIARGDACLIGEPAGQDIITIGEKGVLWLAFMIEGELAHGAYSGGESAILKVCKLIKILENLKKIKGQAPKVLQKLIQDQIRIYKKNGKDKQAYALTHVWVNIGTIKGGKKVNLVPQECDIEVDIRLPLGIKPSDFLNLLKYKIKQAKLTDIQYKILFSMKPNFTHPSEKIVNIARNNVLQLLRIYPKHFFRLGSTDGKFYRQHGIPTITYGPDASTMGRINEFVLIEELVNTAKVHLGVACDFLNLDQRQF